MNYEYHGNRFPPLRIGLIGVGGIARSSHLPALEMLKARGWPITVRAIADPAAESIDYAVRFLASSGVIDPKWRPYHDGAQLLAEGDIDAVLILTTPAVTPALIRVALKCGIPALAEKPVAHNSAALVELIALEKQSCAPLVRIAYNRRSQPLAALFRRSVGELRTRGKGTALDFEARLWRSARKDRIFYEDTMVHALDFTLWTVGPLLLERVDWSDAVASGGLPAAMRATFRPIKAASPSATVVLDVRPSIGRDLECYLALGDGESLKLTYAAGASAQDPAKLVSYKSNNRTEMAAFEPERDSVANIARGFVPQLITFLTQVATGLEPEDDQQLCTLMEAHQTLSLRDEILLSTQPFS